MAQSRLQTILNKNELPLDSELESMILAFIFRVVLSREFTNWLKEYDVSASQALVLRQEINSDGYLLTQVKPYLFWCYVNGIPNKRRKRKKLEKLFQIAHPDRYLVDYLDDPILYKRLHVLDDNAALSYSALQEELARIYEKILPWTNAFIRRKLRFIYQYNQGLSHEDLVHDCITKGMQDILLTYPRIKNRLHALNIGKRSINYHGLSIINRMTRDDAAHLIPASDGFLNRISSYVPELDYRTHSDNGDDNLAILQQYKGKRRVAIHLLMGMYDPKFSEWLLTSNDVLAQHRMDNEALSNHLAMTEYSEYSEYVRTYLDMPQHKFDKLLYSVGNLLGG